MPSKNSVKQYVEGGYYHVYNRGVDKCIIFKDDQDYKVFLHLLKILLSPKPKDKEHPLTVLTGFIPVRLRPLYKTLHKEVDLLAYCLMPNHFHLLLRQRSFSGLTQLMKRLCTTYSMYFNRRHDRVGHLFQGVYKAVNISDDPYLLHLSRYIHLNPIELTGSILVNRSYPYSSYKYYLGIKKSKWVKPKVILSFFRTQQRIGLRDFFSYQSFVEDFRSDPAELVGSLAID